MKDGNKNRALFYERRWYAFSNFSSFSVNWRGALCMTAEHAYQMAKFTDIEIIKKIHLSRSAHDAKKIARAHSEFIRPDWDDEMALETMEEIVRAKLEQHPYVKEMLIETGDMEIVEDSHKDSFWGRGPDWKGENHLGKIWMKLRDEITEGGKSHADE